MIAIEMASSNKEREVVKLTIEYLILLTHSQAAGKDISHEIKKG